MKGNLIMSIIRVVKIPRSSPLQDIEPDFPKLENLHLELSENKLKLKANLPPVPPSKPPKKKKVKSEQTQKEEHREPEHAEHDESGHHEDVQEELVFETKSRVSIMDEDDLNVLNIIAKNTKESKKIEREIVEEKEAKKPHKEEQKEDDAASEASDHEVTVVVSPEEKARNEHTETLWEWRLLAKKWPKYNINPDEFNEHSDLTMMKTKLERKKQEIILDNSVSNYRTYLNMSFQCLEFVACTYIGINMAGFAKEQQKSMDQYDALLIELGVKYSNKFKTNFPIEIRLIGLVLFQGVSFYFMKNLPEVMGRMLGSMIQAKPTQEEEDEDEEPQPTPPRKMRGPNPDTLNSIRKRVVE